MIISLDLKKGNFKYFFQIILLLLLANPVLADDLPFGVFNTPSDGSTVSGTIPVTGWALDDIQVESLTLYFSTGSTYIYLGEAMFIEDARPDIASAYPSYPNNTSAGWAYGFLTNFLSDGTYYIKAVANDNNNNSTELGIKTIIIDNASSTKPFGTLDFPAAGNTISGSNYVINGWVLTPQPNSIPTDGSTIRLYVDGSFIGHPNYNMYREDIANAFPGYTNSNSAGFSYQLDTTPYTSGLHNIYFVATDDAGNTEGLGSRYFYIDNCSLPVELVSFSGKLIYNTVELKWQTATEVNNYGFEIERSVGQTLSLSRDWEKIGFVPGHGNSSSPKSYRFVDEDAPEGNLEYRLKQIDTDGSYAYYGMTAEINNTVTDLDSESSFPTDFSLSQNYPNPFNPSTTINYNIPNAEMGHTSSLHVRLVVYDMLGREVSTLVNEYQAPGNYTVEFDGSELTSGIYFYRIDAGKYKGISKMLLIK